MRVHPVARVARSFGLVLAALHGGDLGKRVRLTDEELLLIPPATDAALRSLSAARRVPLLTLRAAEDEGRGGGQGVAGVESLGFSPAITRA